MKNGFEVEAFLLILATWNFARFRYAVRGFKLSKFQKIIKKLEPHFKKLQHEDFRSINFDDYKKEIRHVFSTFSKIKGVEQTGASKLLHLKNPKVFVMWDKYIREHYGFRRGDADDYFNFLKKMQEIFGASKVSSKDKTLAKLVDEHNYITITTPALNKRKK